VNAPGASPGETKMWAAVRENGVFALAVRITEKLLKTDGRVKIGGGEGVVGVGPSLENR